MQKPKRLIISLPPTTRSLLTVDASDAIIVPTDVIRIPRSRQILEISGSSVWINPGGTIKRHVSRQQQL
ncbi:hypothetical protein [Halochromatium salexigens]|uniref:hypothetical protein n=1 Tax=Halochromatium salexigens TaxID=49447 RepID=UPI001A92B3A4|nr:hypothetical protein [Halochromatium salexigens]